MVGEIQARRAGIVVLCLLVTSLVVYQKPKAAGSHKERLLREALAHFGGWEMVGHPKLEEKVIDSLAVDDYLYATYTDGSSIVSVYIGYYYSSRKVGAAHDPLVCFPGQGWKLSEVESTKLRMNDRDLTDVTISRMVAERGDEKQLIVYWFQAYEATSSGVFGQKIKLLLRKVTSKREDNAFVRISIQMGERGVEEVNGEADRFVRDFYPAFLEFVRE